MCTNTQVQNEGGDVQNEGGDERIVGHADHLSLARVLLLSLAIFSRALAHALSPSLSLSRAHSLSFTQTHAHTNTHTYTQVGCDQEVVGQADVPFLTYSHSLTHTHTSTHTHLHTHTQCTGCGDEEVVGSGLRRCRESGVFQ